jgi:agmatine deiminase
MRTLLCFLAVSWSISLYAQHDKINPPALPVRTPAEWEEMQAVMVAWRTYPTVLTEIIRAAREECMVVVCCDDAATITTAKSILEAANVNITENVTFRVARNNSVWIRDYGPNSVYTNDVDSLFWVDWIYNRNRKRDDTLSWGLRQQLNLPLYSTLQAPYDLVNTGGNFMSDGMGTAFASDLIFRNNDQIQNGEGAINDVFGTSTHTDSSLNAIMLAYMGINRYIKMDELPFDGIHHIDMHIKLLDEETLLVGEYPPGISDGPQIEANLQYILAHFQTAYGTPYKVVRIPMPAFGNLFPPYTSAPGRYPTYANSLIINKTVLIPKYLNTPEINNQEAVAIYEKAMPGYKIVPIFCDDMIDQGGAIHCITKEIGVYDPLRIVHQPILSIPEGVFPPETGHQIKALVQHRTGISSATVQYSVNSPDGPWQEMIMSPTPNTTVYWQATLPNFNAATDTLLYYYIDATAVSGKNSSRPITAPQGWWKAPIYAPISATTELPKLVFQPIFPNPGHGITCVPVTTELPLTGRIQVLNMLGQPIATVFEGTLPAGNSNYFVDTYRYIAGAYIVELNTAAGIKRQIMVVK